MTTDYTLHYAPDNASLIIRIAMDMAGVPYQTCLVDRATQAQQSAAYKAVNPLGMIPALQTPHGALFETGAILLWLADRHGGLLPSVEHTQRGAALKWLFFTSNSLHAGLRQMFYPEKFIAPGSSAALRAGIAERIRADFLQIERVIAEGSLLGTGAAPALDVYLCCLKRWAALYPADHQPGWAHLQAYPALQRLAVELERHPAVKAAITAEGLGAAPFSDPQRAHPPEGSAT